MKTYFDDEDLLDSKEHYQQAGRASYRLFATSSSVYPFVKFEEEIEALNNYCVFIIRQLKNKMIEIAKDSDYVIDFDSCKKAVRDSIASFDDAYEYPSSLLTWELLASDINKCTMLLLWLSYLESSLDEIARWFCDEQGIAFGHQKKGITGVVHCLERISLCCNCNLTEELSEEIAYYNKIRRIRNQFVHREWEQVSDRAQQFSLNRVIDLVSSIIHIVEQKACQTGIISLFEM